MAHEVLLTGLHTACPPSAAPLGAVGFRSLSLDIATVRQRNEDAHVRDEVFVTDLAVYIGDNARSPLIAIFTLEVE
jgi:hypothetical protein